MPANQHHTASASAIFSLGMHNNPMQEFAASAPTHVFTRPLGGRRTNGGGGVPAAAAIEFLLLQRWWRHSVLYLEARRRLDYDLEAQRLLYLEAAGGQAHHRASLLLVAAAAALVDESYPRRVGGGGGVAASVQEPSEFSKMLQLGFMVQAYAAFLPACVTAYPLLKDASDHVKFTVFGGLALITVGLFLGILSRSAARRRLAMRLVSFSAIAVLTFTVASQMSSRTYVAFTALAGVAVNFVIMLLPFDENGAVRGGGGGDGGVHSQAN